MLNQTKPSDVLRWSAQKHYYYSVSAGPCGRSNSGIAGIEESRRLGRGMRRHGLIDVLLLRGMHAHQGLDRLDDPLGVADEIAVDILRRQVLHNTRQQPRQMQDLAMGPAHGGEAAALLENADKLRIDIAFVVALVRDNLLLNNLVGLRDQ